MSMMVRTCFHIELLPCLQADLRTRMELLPGVELRPSAELQMSLGLQQRVAHVVPQFEKWYSGKYVLTL